MNEYNRKNNASADQLLITKIMGLGLTEYKAERLIIEAREKGISLQNAYRMKDASILNADIVLFGVMVFFLGSIAIGDLSELPVALLIFGGTFTVVELFGRFHKGYWKMLRIYRGLKTL
jgi:hypothetical protein